MCSTLTNEYLSLHSRLTFGKFALRSFQMAWNAWKTDSIHTVYGQNKPNPKPNNKFYETDVIWLLPAAVPTTDKSKNTHKTQLDYSMPHLFQFNANLMCIANNGKFRMLWIAECKLVEFM